MLWIWIGFIVFVLGLLALDLGVFNRRAHVVGVKEALGWSALWISLGLAFTAFIYVGYENHWMGLGAAADAVDGRANDGASAAIKYLTGYVLEKSLSVDNIFVIAMLFGFFAVPAIYQHRVLFWGILGALVMRGAMIGVGAALVERFHWLLYVFGGFLILTALKMLLAKDGHSDPSRNVVVRTVRRFFPVTDAFHGQHFLVRAGSAASSQPATPGSDRAADAAVGRAEPGQWMLTPLALSLVMVEATDVIFAVDSVPAIFAVTSDPFLVFTSNVFAMLGLRSLYFALAGMMNKFRYLKVSLALVLATVGGKMLAEDWLKDRLGAYFNLYLLAAVVAILAIGIVASLAVGRREAAEAGTSDPSPKPAS